MERQCYRFRFHADTLCLSVALLDSFLGQVKAKVKYITCLALTCLYLAAKLCEEDEVGGVEWFGDWREVMMQ